MAYIHELLTEVELVEDRELLKETIPGNRLQKGMKIVMNYRNNGLNSWITEIVGFTDDKSAYGENPKKVYDSVKDLLTAYKVRTLKELEELQDKNEYGFHTYMITKDDEMGEGPYTYLFKGRWSVGSGADRVSFGWA